MEPTYIVDRGTRWFLLEYGIHTEERKRLFSALVHTECLKLN